MQLLFVSMAYAIPRPQAPKGAPPSYGKQPDGYFQYVNVPGHKEYEFGWNRGHPNHYISRYEQSKDHRFRTRVSLFVAQFKMSGDNEVEMLMDGKTFVYKRIYEFPD